jgi:hypothetical protein
VSRSRPIQDGAAGPRGGVEGGGDGSGQVLEPVGQVQAGVQPGLVEPFVEDADLATQVSDLRGQGGQALAQSLGRGVVGLGRGHDGLPSNSAYR